MPRVKSRETFKAHVFGDDGRKFQLAQYRFVAENYDSPAQFVVIDDDLLVRQIRRFLKRGFRRVKKQYGNVPRKYRPLSHANCHRTVLICEEVL